MSHKCAVINCKNSKRKSSNSNNPAAENFITFFDFPSSSDLKTIWLKNIGRPHWKPPKSAYICSNHFHRLSLTFVLDKDAVPLKPELQAINSSKSSLTRLTKTSLKDQKRKRDHSMESIYNGPITRRRQTVLLSLENDRLKKIKLKATSPKRIKRVLSKAIPESNSLNESKTPLGELHRVNKETSKNHNLLAASSTKSVANKVDTSKKSLKKYVATSSKNTRHVTNGANNVSNSQTRITNFFCTEGSLPQDYKENDERLRIEDTIFGWATLGIDYIPYIVYQSEKYCSMRMIASTKTAKMLTETSGTGKCKATIDCFGPNEIQCILLNEINTKHCDYAYGRPKFNANDVLVRLSDAQKYYFLEICDTVSSTGAVGLEFGFTLIDEKSYIPYTILEGEKFIPLIYLNCNEEVLDILKSKAFTIPSKNELHLKFCCKYDGISADIFEESPLEVINFAELMKLSPPTTDYKDCWPTEGGNYQLKIVRTAKGLRLKHVKRSLDKHQFRYSDANFLVS